MLTILADSFLVAARQQPLAHADMPSEVKRERRGLRQIMRMVGLRF